MVWGGTTCTGLKCNSPDSVPVPFLTNPGLIDFRKAAQSVVGQCTMTEPAPGSAPATAPVKTEEAVKEGEKNASDATDKPDLSAKRVKEVKNCILCDMTFLDLPQATQHVKSKEHRLVAIEAGYRGKELDKIACAQKSVPDSYALCNMVFNKEMRFLSTSANSLLKERLQKYVDRFFPDIEKELKAAATAFEQRRLTMPTERLVQEGMCLLDLKPSIFHGDDPWSARRQHSSKKHLRVRFDVPVLEPAAQKSTQKPKHLFQPGDLVRLSEPRLVLCTDPTQAGFIEGVCVLRGRGFLVVDIEREPSAHIDHDKALGKLLSRLRFVDGFSLVVEQCKDKLTGRDSHEDRKFLQEYAPEDVLPSKASEEADQIKDTVGEQDSEEAGNKMDEDEEAGEASNGAAGKADEGGQADMEAETPVKEEAAPTGATAGGEREGPALTTAAKDPREAGVAKLLQALSETNPKKINSRWRLDKGPNVLNWSRMQDGLEVFSSIKFPGNDFLRHAIVSLDNEEGRAYLQKCYDDDRLGSAKPEDATAQPKTETEAEPKVKAEEDAKADAASTAAKEGESTDAAPVPADSKDDKAASSDSQETQESEAEHKYQEALKIYEAWVRVEPKGGKEPYFWNNMTKVSQWTEPNPPVSPAQSAAAAAAAAPTVGKAKKDKVGDPGLFAQLDWQHQAAHVHKRLKSQSWLDEAQKAAVIGTLLEDAKNKPPIVKPGPGQKGVARTGQARLVCLEGPAGTGKTSALVELVRLYTLFFPMRSHGPVLCCAPSVSSLDRLTEGLLDAGLKVVRLGGNNPQTGSTIGGVVGRGLYKYTVGHLALKLPKSKQLAMAIDKATALEHQLPSLINKTPFGPDVTLCRNRLFQARKKVRQMWHSMQLSIMSQAQVICCTCSEAGGEELRSINFSMVVVDDACSASEPLTLVPALLARRRLVLAGDSTELPLLSTAFPSLGQHSIMPSLFSRVLEHYPLPTKQEEGQGVKKEDTEMITSETSEDHAGALPLPDLKPIACFRLDTQHRAHPLLFSWMKRTFYYSQLQDGPSAAERAPPAGLPWPKAGPFAFFALKGSEQGTDESSKQNETEAAATARVVERLLQAGELCPGDMAVVAVSTAQVTLLRTMVKTDASTHKEGGVLDICSLDDMQGKEKEVIIFSCVRSNSQGEVGTLGNASKLKLLLSRARRGMVMLGDPSTLRANETWESLLAFVETEKLELPLDCLDAPVQKVSKPRVSDKARSNFYSCDGKKAQRLPITVYLPKPFGAHDRPHPSPKFGGPPGPRKFGSGSGGRESGWQGQPWRGPPRPDPGFNRPRDRFERSPSDRGGRTDLGAPYDRRGSFDGDGFDSRKRPRLNEPDQRRDRRRPPSPRMQGGRHAEFKDVRDFDPEWAYKKSSERDKRDVRGPEDQYSAWDSERRSAANFPGQYSSSSSGYATPRTPGSYDPFVPTSSTSAQPSYPAQAQMRGGAQEPYGMDRGGSRGGFAGQKRERDSDRRDMAGGPLAGLGTRPPPPKQGNIGGGGRGFLLAARPGEVPPPSYGSGVPGGPNPYNPEFMRQTSHNPYADYNYSSSQPKNYEYSKY
eukprot:g82566.t1